MGASCCHGNQSFDPICPKTMQLSATPVMLHIKFYQDWQTGFRDIQVWKCGLWRRTTDHWYTLSSPCEPSAQVSYTLWAFGSGELENKTKKCPKWFWIGILHGQGRESRSFNLYEFRRRFWLESKVFTSGSKYLRIFDVHFNHFW